MTDPALCFVVMPFRADLNFFYLYLRRHLEEMHGLRVERGDHRVLTVPLLDKIREQITEARVIIADITGRNPNVFYELGLAHASEKPVILLTQDGADDIPTDIRHLEFIAYDLGRDVELLAKVDNAIRNVFFGRYEELHRQARGLLQEFNQTCGAQLQEATVEVFQARVVQGERTQGMPAVADGLLMAGFLLPRIIQDIADHATIHLVTDWLASRYRT